MIRIFVLVVILVLGGLIASWLRTHPGLVSVEWLGWRADTSVAMVAFLVVLITILGAVLYRFWRVVISAPGNMIRSRRSTRRQRGYEALSAGMIAAASGDSDEARRQARRAETLLHEAGVTRLLRAEAARLSGDETTARQTYEEMSQDPDTALLGLRGLLDHAETTGDKAEALRLAEKAYTLRPRAQGIAQRLLDLQVDFAQWDAADRTLREAMGNKIVPAADGKHRRAALLIERSRLAEANGNAESALTLAREAHQLDPQRIPAAVRYGRLLGAQGKTRRAQRMLEKIWAQHPHPDIAAAYGGLFDGEGPLDLVKRYQRLLSFRPDHVEGHIALAGAALDAELWGEARAHLTRAAEQALTPRVCRMLSELEEAEHGDLEAARQWLQRATTAASDPAWVCDSCGAAAGSWSARCGHCGAFDSLGWHPPPQAARLPQPDATPLLPGRAADEVEAAAQS